MGKVVIDLSKLNTYISWPVHLFPSALDIVSNIDEGTWYFAKLNAVLGFYQIELEEESSYLTTFLFLQGCFRWLLCLMGSCTSSDKWCQRSDDAIRGLVGVNKLIDDILIAAKTKEELFQRITSVLERCQKASITLLKRKLVNRFLLLVTCCLRVVYSQTKGSLTPSWIFQSQKTSLSYATFWG